jgi:hypothetical protein
MDHFLFGFSFLTGTSIALGVIAATCMIVIAEDRRIMLVALVFQYVLAGLLFSQMMPSQVVIVKVLSGLLLCLIFLVSAWQTGWSPRRLLSGTYGQANTVPLEPRQFLGNKNRKPSTLGGGIALRVFAVILVGVVGIQLYTRYTTYSLQEWLPEAPDGVILAAVQMMCLGLLVVGLTDEPLRVGIGLLTVMTGFGLFYSLLDPALVVIGLLSAVELSVTLGTSYLAIVEARSSGGTKTDRL